MNVSDPDSTLIQRCVTDLYNFVHINRLTNLFVSYSCPMECLYGLSCFLFLHLFYFEQKHLFFGLFLYDNAALHVHLVDTKTNVCTFLIRPTTPSKCNSKKVET